MRKRAVAGVPCEAQRSGIKQEVLALEGAGLIRAIDISHYDPAREDIASEPAIFADPELLARAS